jgi:hypothetical protein
MKNKETLLETLVETIKFQNLSQEGGYEYDSYQVEIDEIWGQLNDLGMSTEDINHHCWNLGIL